jgi:hypothetical protein
MAINISKPTVKTLSIKIGQSVGPTSLNILYVAPDGSDVTGTGRIDAPLATRAKAYSIAAPGNSIILKTGVV